MKAEQFKIKFEKLTKERGTPPHGYWISYSHSRNMKMECTYKGFLTTPKDYKRELKFQIGLKKIVDKRLELSPYKIHDVLKVSDETKDVMDLHGLLIIITSITITEKGNFNYSCVHLPQKGGRHDDKINEMHTSFYLKELVPLSKEELKDALENISIKNYIQKSVNYNNEHKELFKYQNPIINKEFTNEKKLTPYF